MPLNQPRTVRLNLPKSARLASSEITVFNQFAQTVDLEGSLVVEIGGCLPKAIVEKSKASRWFSCDPAIADGSDGILEVLGQEAENIPLEDGSVDCIFSCNAMQHVTDPERVFEEARRVLRPGGVFYANFGPVWSAPDGAHIEALVIEGKRFDFWSHSILPKWAHLVVDDEHELIEALCYSQSKVFAEHVAAYVFRSDWINRTPADHFKSLARRHFELTFFGGNSEFDYLYESPVISPNISNRLAPDNFKGEIRKRHPAINEDVFSRDIEFVLIRKHDDACT